MKISVLTPTYKGANNIKRVFDSLKNQTFKDFEWVVILDGHDENTIKILNEFKEEKLFFKITVNTIKHNHKKAAHNKGIKICKGDFVCIADDDDSFPSDALEQFINAWNSIPNQKKDSYVGVTGLCIDNNNNIIGDKFPEDLFHSNALDCSLKYKIKGEKWGMLRRDVLLKYPFFEKPEGYVGESTVWFAIARKYKTLYFNKVVRNYLFNELSIMNAPYSKKKISTNCQAYTFGYRDTIINNFDYFKYNPIWFIKCSIQYTRYLIHSLLNKKYRHVWMNPFVNLHLFLLFIFTFLISLFFVVKDILKYRSL